MFGRTFQDTNNLCGNKKGQVLEIMNLSRLVHSVGQMSNFFSEDLEKISELVTPFKSKV